jgi:hypothetical protein
MAKLNKLADRRMSRLNKAEILKMPLEIALTGGNMQPFRRDWH